MAPSNLQELISFNTSVYANRSSLDKMICVIAMFVCIVNCKVGRYINAYCIVLYCYSPLYSPIWKSNYVDCIEMNQTVKMAF